MSNIGKVVENGVVLVIREIVRFLVITIWAVIGVIFWIPLLARMILYFSSSILISAFANRSVGNAQAGLDVAVRFYVTGFTKINRAISNPKEESKIIPLNIKFILKVIPDIGITLLFWLFVGWLANFITIDFQKVFEYIINLLIGKLIKP